MIQTIIFRLYPSEIQEKKLHEIFTIYNRAKRKGYRLLLKRAKKDGKTIVFEGEKQTQQELMNFCHNNPYVNTIIIENKTKLKAQDTWLYKTKDYLEHKIKVVKEKIDKIKNKNDRRIKGLYSRLSSLQNKIIYLENSLRNEILNLRIKPIVFGSKKLFRKRILHKINKQEFKVRRDASFGCVGKKQGVNLNLKILPSRKLKIRTFSKEKEKKWIEIPFSVNEKQKKHFQKILKAEKYTAIVKRKLIKNELRYYVHFSYDIKDLKMKYSFENGAVGLDFNYNFVTLTNTDNNGELKSYNQINFRNLHSYRKDKRNDYISFKLDKIINYCINKKKGLVIENLSFNQQFSYNKNLNKKISNFKTSALELLKRKCIKKGVDFREVHPAYTSLIGKYKYSRLHNLSNHVLASFVIARRGLGFKEEIPSIYKWVLSQVGDIIKPRLKKGSPYYEWSKIHDFFKHNGITSFKTPEIVKKIMLVKDVLNSIKGVQLNNLRAGLSKNEKINDYHKFWNFIDNFQFL
ncbi:MAG: IS200/IS605 family element transposase accessory protein TnpB [Candidatus Helarchaeota archaeon]|nr:IS200/IS605 family element transposase accessory protein TnpB [Candidatus Helarchaeota archaeon]